MKKKKRQSLVMNQSAAGLQWQWIPVGLFCMEASGIVTLNVCLKGPQHTVSEKLGNIGKHLIAF